MRKELLIPADTLYYSVFTGWNRYHETGRQYRWLDGTLYPEAENLPAAECFHLRPLRTPFDPQIQRFVTEHILPEPFILPIDIVTKPGQQPEYYGVFRNLQAAELQNLADFTARRNVIEEPEDAECALRYARRIVRDAAQFYACGYAYYGWYAELIFPSVNGERLYYDDSGNTDMAQKTHPFPAEGRAKLSCDPFQTEYGTDLDYFGFMVLLFYVLIGKYPYDGRLMDGLGAATALEQAAWYDAYRKNCIFLFHPENRLNSIGTFAHEEKFRQRWDALPADVRAVFTETFCNFGTARQTVSPAELMQRCAFFRGA